MRATRSRPVPLYGPLFEVYVANDLRAVGLALKLDAETLPDDQTMAMAFNYAAKSRRKESRGLPSTRFALMLRPNASVDTIAHESVHVASQVFHWAGASISDGEQNEPLAYLVGWVAAQVSKALLGA